MKNERNKGKESWSKQEIIELINSLHAPFSLEDLLYELYFRYIIHERLNDDDSSYISHEDVMQQLNDKFAIGKEIVFHDKELVEKVLETWLIEREFPRELRKKFVYLGSTPLEHQFKNINTGKYLKIDVKD